jgi:hypothetical protein
VERDVGVDVGVWEGAFRIKCDLKGVFAALGEDVGGGFDQLGIFDFGGVFFDA